LSAIDNSAVTVLTLLSGGIDSAACARFLQQRDNLVSGFYVDYGQPAAQREMTAAREIARLMQIELQITTFRTEKRFGAGEIKGRNTFLIFAALVGANKFPSAIALGLHSGTPYIDSSPFFLESVSRLASEYTDGSTVVLAPFINWSKAEVYQYARENGVPVDITYSCEVAPACGRCNSCLDRQALGC
jgi:7-cyano-7-deazaguanine synthase